jgi:hypothetical protein
VLAPRTPDFQLRSHTLIEKATRCGASTDSTALQSLVKSYAATADADEGLGALLEGILRRARLMPGTRFPAFDATDLNGKPVSIPTKAQRPQVVAFFRLRGTLGSAGRGPEDLEQAAQLAAAVKEAGSLDLLVVSVDLDAPPPGRGRQARRRDLPVAWQEPTDPKRPRSDVRDPGHPGDLPAGRGRQDPERPRFGGRRDGRDQAPVGGSRGGLSHPFPHPGADALRPRTGAFFAD